MGGKQELETTGHADARPILNVMNKKMESGLSKDAKRLLSAIVGEIREGKITPGNPKSYIGYGEAHTLMGIKKIGPTWGVSLMKQGLTELAQWTVDRNVPKVTGLIVDQKTFRPGKGYFKLFRIKKEKLVWWHMQARDSIAFDWSSYIPEQDLPSWEELVDYEKAIIEGKVYSISVKVRKRCDALKRRAKNYHRGEDEILRCRACGWYNPAPASFKGNIVDMHHLYSLKNMPSEGKKLNLSEAIKNLVPLCPTCHRLIHALPKGETHSLEDLKYLLKKYPQQGSGADS